MKSYLFALAFVISSALSQAQTPPDSADYQVVPETCTPQKPRFPVAYAKYKELRAASKERREYLIDLSPKDPDTDLQVQAELQEVDLTGDGVCDNVVVVMEPLNRGGDRDVLTTIYLANRGRWQRIGAPSAEPSDLPDKLILKQSPTDSDFEFDGYVVLRRPGQAPTYLVAWHAGRVANHGFDGYRVYKIDPAHSALRLIDKWNNEGAKVYAAFKRAKYDNGQTIFEPDFETDELRTLCEHGTEPNPGLIAECRRLKR